MQSLPLGVITFTDTMTRQAMSSFALELEDLGYESLWIPELFGREPIATCGYLLAQTSRLKIATGIAVLYARGAYTAGQARHTLGELGGGRFLMGLGVSHPDLVAPRDVAWEPPVEKAIAYLQAMEKVEPQSPAPAERVPTLLAAHGPKLLRVAAEYADGAHMYLVTPERVRLGREILGPEKQLRACVLSCMCDDLERARATARKMLAFYIRFPAYHRQWRQSGFDESDWQGAGSDRLVDHIFALGSRDALLERYAEYIEAGANQVLVSTVSPREDVTGPDLEALRALAPGKA